MTLRTFTPAAAAMAGDEPADGRHAQKPPAAGTRPDVQQPAAPAAPDADDAVRVPLRWRNAFETFIDTGHLDPAFRDALDHEADLKEAVDHAFRREVEALGQIGRALRAQGAVARAAAGAAHAGTDRRAVHAFSSTLQRLFRAEPRERDTILDAARQDLEDARTNPASAPAADRAIRSLEVLREHVQSDHE